jgi:hypothetical protein
MAQKYPLRNSVAIAPNKGANPARSAMMDNTTQVIRTYLPLPLQANVSMSLRIFIFAQR